MRCTQCARDVLSSGFSTSSQPPNSKPGGIESVAAISMGHGALVWPLPVVRSRRHRFGIGIARCGRLRLGGPSRPWTIQQRFFVSTLQLPRLGHVSLLLLGLSSGSRHLDGRLGCESYWYAGLCGCYSSSPKGSSKATHPCHARHLQLRHGASLQRVPEGDGTVVGHCHLDRQPESCRQLV